MPHYAILHTLNSSNASSENNNSLIFCSFFTINSIIKYTGVAVGASGLIIALLGALASKASNKKVKTIQPSTMPATISASSNAEEKSELEKERY